jgi:hypothetical protein
MVVLYFFHVNGGYATTRTEVRSAHMNPFDRYAYYAKVELWFSDESLRVLANRNVSLDAAGRLLRKLLPALLEDHFQDWKTWVAKQKAAGQAEKPAGVSN